MATIENETARLAGTGAPLPLPAMERKPAKLDYAAAAADIKAGKVVQVGGRTAATLAELDYIKGLPDGSEGTDAVITYSHATEADTVVVLSPLDEVGANAQPFSPQVVQANKPDANAPGPTSLGTGSTDAAPAPAIKTGK